MTTRTRAAMAMVRVFNVVPFIRAPLWRPRSKSGTSRAICEQARLDHLVSHERTTGRIRWTMPAWSPLAICIETPVSRQ